VLQGSGGSDAPRGRRSNCSELAPRTPQQQQQQKQTNKLQNDDPWPGATTHRYLIFMPTKFFQFLHEAFIEIVVCRLHLSPSLPSLLYLPRSFFLRLSFTPSLILSIFLHTYNCRSFFVLFSNAFFLHLTYSQLKLSCLSFGELMSDGRNDVHWTIYTVYTSYSVHKYTLHTHRTTLFNFSEKKSLRILRSSPSLLTTNLLKALQYLGCWTSSFILHQSPPPLANHFFFKQTKNLNWSILECF